MLLKAALADGLTTESHWASITQDPEREWAARWQFRTTYGTPAWDRITGPEYLDSVIETTIENERLDEEEKANSPFWQILMDELQSPQE